MASGVPRRGTSAGFVASRTRLRRLLRIAVFPVMAAPVAAQTPQLVVERLTFDEAVARATARHPSIAEAAAGIRRAQAVLEQARAATRPAINASATTTTIDPVPSFSGFNVIPRTQLLAGIGLSVPVVTPVRWAQQNQAADQVAVAERASDEARRQIALATAQAYLQIITLRRVLELNERARETARAHAEFARQRFEAGLGSRLNLLRAEQELSADEARVEEARLAVRRAQAALGVLVAADGPVDAADEPVFDLPGETSPDLIATRADVRLATAEQAAAARVVRDSWRDRLPSVTALFDPQILEPSGLFRPPRSWTATILFQVPVFDAGSRRGLALERQARLDAVRADRERIERAARSEIRIAFEAVRSTERALASARAGASQASEVLKIADVAFRAGATTNIELIDAQRGARDAETAAAVAEDAVRRARLELLVATGRFPK